MNDDILVSVIINCYNGDKYVNEAIDSVIKQNYKNWELIFWDNCSTDRTPEIVKSYKDQRIKYYKGIRNVPLGEARNLGIEKANGAYIGFLDADDIWEDNKLSVQVEKMQTRPEIGLVHSNYLNFWEGGEVIANHKKVESEETFQYLLIHYKIGMSAALIRKSVLVNFNIQFDKTLSLLEDFDFFLSIAYHFKVLYCAEVLMRYRMHPESLTNVAVKNWSNEFYYYLTKLKSSLSQVEISNYKAELNWLKIRAINASVTESLSKNRRIDALYTILRNLYRSPKLLFPIWGVIFGYASYVKVLSLIRKTNYRHNEN